MINVLTPELKTAVKRIARVSACDSTRVVARIEHATMDGETTIQETVNALSLALLEALDALELETEFESFRRYRRFRRN